VFASSPPVCSRFSELSGWSCTCSLNCAAPHISSFTRFSANFFHEERDRTFPDVTPSQLQQMQDAFHGTAGVSIPPPNLQCICFSCARRRRSSRGTATSFRSVRFALGFPRSTGVTETAEAAVSQQSSQHCSGIELAAGWCDRGESHLCLSRLSMILLNQTLWGSEYSCFYKLFARKQGKSGGTCDGTCPHGVQYYQKFLFLAETPLVRIKHSQFTRFAHRIRMIQDTVAALAQFKHLPTIAFFDAWCCVEPGLRKVLAKVLRCCVLRT